ncbi:MAG: Na+/H+ antiporter NhaA [Micromonosporaceae bacterium]|nr:Na+/H+ antiporter NhaA [Micromonosporaceae bacterium]
MRGMRPRAWQRTEWHERASPVRRFLETQTAGAAALAGAAIVALVWANLDHTSYEAVFATPLSIQFGDAGTALSLHEWINSGLMTFFFFVVGLEARREFDLGEFRQRRLIVVPLVAGAGAMLVPVLIFSLINLGEESSRAWGTALSTDTALALGVLALVGRRLPTPVRIFVLTMSVVDDFVALFVIAVFYSHAVQVKALLVALAIFLVILGVRALKVHVGLVYFLLAVACWFALLESGIDPIVLGLAMGMITYAYPAPRERLERASDLFRRFREQPTPQLARSVRLGVAASVSPNDRLQLLYHPWVSYVIVPLFALANAGVVLTGEALVRVVTSPIGLGILLGLVLGKPLGTLGLTWVLAVAARGRVTPPVGWASVLGSGTVSIAAFTVSLLIARIALQGEDLEVATIAILASIPLAALLTWIVFLVTNRLPKQLRRRALYGNPNLITDLAVPVDPERDHIRGPMDAPVTVVEYGDFECPHCGQAEPVIRELLADYGDVRYVWRHLPLTDVHPHAQLAAEAAEAAAAQGAFWAMHDRLFQHQDALTMADLVRYADQLGLDVEAFERDLRERTHADRVAADLESADLSSVSGTPTFFINGRRHHGAYDITALKSAVRLARALAREPSPSGAQNDR